MLWRRKGNPGKERNMASIADPGDRRGDVMSRFEFEDELLADGFTSMPNTVLFYRGVTMGAKATYLVLLSYAWQEMKVWPGQGRMAAQLGISLPTLRKHLTELTRHHIIQIRRRGQGLTSVMVFKKLDHLRSKESFSPDNNPPRDPGPQERLRPEGKPAAPKNYKTKNTKVVPLPDTGSTRPDAEQRWFAAVEVVRSAGTAPANLWIFEGTQGLRIDRGVLIVGVAGSAALRVLSEHWGRRMAQAAGMPVRFEPG